MLAPLLRIASPKIISDEQYGQVTCAFIAALNSVSSNVRSGSMADFIDQLLTIFKHSVKFFGAGDGVAGVACFAKIRLSMPIMVGILPERHVWLYGALNHIGLPVILRLSLRISNVQIVTSQVSGGRCFYIEHPR
jgi:hypothetical protein